DPVAETSSRFILVEPDRLRIEGGSRTWSQKDHRFMIQESIQVYDGDRHVHYFPIAGIGFPNAFISLGRGNRSSMGEVARLIPLLMVYRSMHEMSGPLLGEDAVLDSGLTVIDGRPSVRIRFRQRGLDRELYCDVERDFLPLLQE